MGSASGRRVLDGQVLGHLPAGVALGKLGQVAWGAAPSTSLRPGAWMIVLQQPAEPTYCWLITRSARIGAIGGHHRASC